MVTSTTLRLDSRPLIPSNTMISSLHHRFRIVFVVLAAAAALLVFNGHVAQAQAVRRVPSCIDPEVAKTFGWVGQQPADSSIAILQDPPANVNIEYNAWASANLTGYVSTMILRQVMGVNATLVEYSSSRNLYPRAATGVSHVNVEVWPNNKVALYNQFVRQAQTVEDLGLLGYIAKISWFINTAVADNNPNIIFDSWRAFQQPSVLNFLPTVGTTAPGNRSDGTFLCTPSRFAFCGTDGMFTPPQCQGNLRSGCREFWHSDPSYSTGENEQRIISLGLKLVIVYVGLDRFDQLVATCASQNSYACIFYWWKPEILPSRYQLTEVKLPPYTDTAYARFNSSNVGGPNQYLGSDFTIDLIHKVGSADMRTWAPMSPPSSGSSASAKVTWSACSTTGILEAARRTRRRVVGCKQTRPFGVGGSQGRPQTTVRSFSCLSLQLEKKNPPYSCCLRHLSAVRYLDSMQSGEGLSIAVIILCAMSFLLGVVLIGLLFKYRKSKAVLSQSPAFMAIIAIGGLVISASIALEIIPASDETCRARTWLLALGLCLVLASIATKTFRLYQIFGNKRMRLVKLGTKKLMSYMAVFVLIDVILLAVWTAVSNPGRVISSVSATTFTYVCGVNGSTGLDALSIVLIVYHGALLLAAVVLSYKVRNVSSEYNESKWIGMASYQILLACIIVIPVVYLPINFRAQFIIKCIMILACVYGVSGLLIARPVIEAISTSSDAAASASQAPIAGSGLRFSSMKGQASPNASSSVMRHSSTNRGTKGQGGEDQGVLYGNGFSVRPMTGLFRRWIEFNFTLAMGAHPGLMLSPGDDKKVKGESYSALVYAQALDTADRERLPGCFLLRLEANSYLVQTNDAAEAEAWVNAITSAFAAVNATHSRGGGSNSGSQHKSTAAGTSTVGEVGRPVIISCPQRPSQDAPTRLNRMSPSRDGELRS
ncbi:7 transmembrane sweet-taste receptor of 3 GCPR-domain-containing protein [Catenaria anguillulae PL171]|uniref:7 transmembrane sweet-taste receptor of 3 GCPR-domain-containing protein n=1 Tax=Catenaria anguillulae PL171 TaxID=765915 RepID=A0A1Y2I4P3_9FUNG|nr:7 transmembrane sweet-taste receptor of 3 GCPR-domain-containing protein [Catenaria anguillulae PL171]